MRWINCSTLEAKLPVDWKQNAEKALIALRGMVGTQRANTIDDYDKLWKQLKELLKEISNDKCWYCEAIDIRSDNAVDHYRPKNRVYEVKGHEGYWWLAFDWRNYRYTCTFCNSGRTSAQGTKGGKQDHFPLVDETKRVHSEKDWSKNQEFPQLLDPTIAADIGLIWFDQTGMAVPKKKQEEKIVYERAKVSIAHYHLNHPDTREARELVCRKILDWVRDAEFYFEQYTLGADVHWERAASDKLKELKEAIREDAEFSAAAKCTLKGLRNPNSHDSIPDMVLDL